MKFMGCSGYYYVLPWFIILSSVIRFTALRIELGISSFALPWDQFKNGKLVTFELKCYGVLYLLSVDAYLQFLFCLFILSNLKSDDLGELVSTTDGNILESYSLFYRDFENTLFNFDIVKLNMKVIYNI